MEIDTTNLEKYNPENLNTLQQVEFAIKDVQKEEERLKQVLNLTNGEQTQLREVLSNVQHRLIQLYEKYDKLESDELEATKKKQVQQINFEDNYTPEIDPTEIEFTEKDFLGQGSFGRVYAGRCRGKRVAVKVPLKQDLSEKELEDFRQEVILMNRIRCSNCVLFMGACSVKGQLQIVTELLYTDLDKILRSNRELTIYQRIKMMKDAALGLNWIHGINSVIHRDLKPANLLVDENLTVKITDFGFSQLKQRDILFIESKGVARGSPLWMAPEILSGRKFNEKADIYSFGIILWQMITREEPFGHHDNIKVFRHAVVKQQERPVIPVTCPDKIATLMTNCWSADPDERPDVKSIILSLDEILVDTVVTNNSANAFWKQNFLYPRQELLEQLSWNDFIVNLQKTLQPQTHVPNFQRDTFRKLKELLAEQSIDESKFIVTMQKFNNIATSFGNFYTPCDEAWRVLEEIRLLIQKDWFHGEIDRELAEKRLQNRSEGSFLVRLSFTTPEYPFTISLPKGHHRRVHHLPGGDYSTKGSRAKYNSLIQLIENCKDEELGSLLRHPCPKNIVQADWGYR